ncbi:hypothetical protein GKD24_06770 [Lactobacillus paracasei]|uniref:Uncharacterized protein n=1 Tax=Lacticaseibacillus paracasei (strain ATCC 334 / BCRC 17002 / CCUG 31169 / CIP 107868 / KCTC 3260 / NRRL B-441) TaxID=321967 RepID=Q035E2_LACP3|nr:hypothetical protein LSEI_2444 [Lacticaseibacillus paracasei ATCC 334]MSC18059.1 hypothetical protein [Lacticaseibacillus paracasei]PTS56080.1 hypothetical protein DBQ61_10375 [Lactobacillus sp. DS22_6]MSC30979.1 hypothetical protein [Lacticaseibacillus paracasei]MSC37305.1 hypothetical protein [Lacticaseibacillus paracasei]
MAIFIDTVKAREIFDSRGAFSNIVFQTE